MTCRDCQHYRRDPRTVSHEHLERDIQLPRCALAREKRDTHILVPSYVTTCEFFEEQTWTA